MCRLTNRWVDGWMSDWISEQANEWMQIKIEMIKELGDKWMDQRITGQTVNWMLRQTTDKMEGQLNG